MADEQNKEEQQRGKLDQSDPKKKPFTPESLDRTVIAIPLLKTLEAEAAGKADPTPHKVIIDLNLEFPGGREAASKWVIATIKRLLANAAEKDQEVFEERSKLTPQYVFA